MWLNNVGPKEIHSLRQERTGGTELLMDLIKLLSDDKSVLIFNTIIFAGGDSSEILRTQLEISKKQY
jgi:hypothetical protein